MRFYNFLKDFLFTKEILYIQKNSSFVSALEDIESKNILAVDTEFIWRNTYFPKLCLIQVATQNKIYIFDSLTIEISRLEKVLTDQNVTKIFHSVRGDSSVLFNCLGIKIKNIFDTQLAEDLLSQKNNNNQISYKKLVRKYFLKDISKSETNSDWEKRPLQSSQIDYAADDVRYLHSIMKLQQKKLFRIKKLELFNELCEREKKLGEEDFSLSRLRRLKKKNKNLSKLEIKIFNWREEEAKKLNVPPSHIIENNNLKRLKKILDTNKFDECRWIIKSELSRVNFLKKFK